MTKSIAVTVLLSALLTGCASVVRHAGVDCVILPKEQSWYAATMCGHEKFAAWKPSEKDVASAFPKVESLFRQLPIPHKLTEYRCQAVGVISGGRRYIHFNFFPKNPDGFSYWKDTPVGVDDGGDSYFQIDFDVESQKCIRYHINGEA